jgi:hypothetical protein
MRKFALVLGMVTVAAPSLFVTSAQAQAVRTWISGVGDDVNPCSRTAPCKTFPGAISKTAAGGEIDTLDPGGFGAVTVIKAITLADEGVGEGGILVAGTNGITVNCSTDPNCVVVVRGLQIDGGPASPPSNSLAGIKFFAGKALEVQNCVIRNFTGGSPNGYGISFTPNSAAQLDVTDSVITTNGQPGGGSATGAGINIIPTAGGSANVTIVRTTLSNNTNGIRIDNTSAAAPTNVVISDSTVANSGTHGIAIVNPTTGTPQKDTVTVDHTIVSGNFGDGVVANGVNSTIFLNNSVISGNGKGAQTNNSGVINTYKNNAFTGNAADLAAGTTLVPATAL